MVSWGVTQGSVCDFCFSFGRRGTTSATTSAVGAHTCTEYRPPPACRRRLSNPSGAEERDDSHMVGAIVQRLIHAYKAKTGDDFDGAADSEFDRLYDISKAVLGSGITKSLLRELVKSYLHSAET